MEKHPDLIGTVTIKNGGHISLPEDALTKLGLTDGDELVVFVGGLKQRIILSRPENFEEKIDHAIGQLKAIKCAQRLTSE